MKFRHISEVLRLQGLQKNFGSIFTIYASKNEPVGHLVQTHFGSSLPASFAEEVLGAFSRFMCPKMKLFAVKFRRILEVFCLQVLQKFLAHYHDLCVQKWSCLLLNSDAFLKFSLCEVYEENSGRIIMIFASTNKAVCCEVQAHFESSLPATFTEKVMGVFSRYMRPKMKLFPAKFKRISDVFTLWGL